MPALAHLHGEEFLASTYLLLRPLAYVRKVVSYAMGNR